MESVESEASEVAVDSEVDVDVSISVIRFESDVREEDSVVVCVILSTSTVLEVISKLEDELADKVEVSAENVSNEDVVVSKLVLDSAEGLDESDEDVLKPMERLVFVDIVFLSLSDAINKS